MIKIEMPFFGLDDGRRGGDHLADVGRGRRSTVDGLRHLAVVGRRGLEHRRKYGVTNERKTQGLYWGGPEQRLPTISNWRFDENGGTVSGTVANLWACDAHPKELST
ncbi:hypothetical protein THAOC_10140, partial [Thalassiosira oceanica]